MPTGAGVETAGRPVHNLGDFTDRLNAYFNGNGHPFLAEMHSGNHGVKVILHGIGADRRWCGYGTVDIEPVDGFATEFTLRLRRDAPPVTSAVLERAYLAAGGKPETVRYQPE